MHENSRRLTDLVLTLKIAKRIMRDRKREKQQLEKLGTLTPISTSTLSSSSSVPLGHVRNLILYKIGYSKFNKTITIIIGNCN